MHTTRRLPAAVALALTLGSAPSAQVLEWERRYDGPGESIEAALAIAVDAAGQVYVSGTSELFGGGNSAYATIKYAPSGDTLWVRRFDVLGGGPLALDDSGNAYVTGAPVTLKYSPDGDLLWSHENDAGFVGLALNAEGSVVVAGTSLPANIKAAKLSPDGAALWEAVYDGPARFADEGNDLALDSEGHVVVAGQSWGLVSKDDGTQWNYATVKFDAATGDTLWARHYDGPAAALDVPSDFAFAVAVDEADNIYVSGWSDGVSDRPECLTLKYSPDGDVLWERRYTGGGACYDLLYDRGFLYAAARGGGGDRLLKYDVEGNLLWARLYATEIGFATNDPRLAADRAGNVYMTSLATALDPQGGVRTDYAVLKYTPDGERAWEYRHPGSGPAGRPNLARAITVDEEANVYVTGEGFSDYLTLKLAQPPVAAEPEPTAAGFRLGRRLQARAELPESVQRLHDDPVHAAGSGARAAGGLRRARAGGGRAGRRAEGGGHPNGNVRRLGALERGLPLPDGGRRSRSRGGGVLPGAAADPDRVSGSHVLHHPQQYL